MANEDETPPPPKSAEDRKAASALANLDSAADDATTTTTEVDQEAIHKAIKGLPADSATATASGGGSSSSSGAGAGAKHAKPKKAFKLDPEDVSLLVEQLEVSKARAGELLKQHEGSAVAVLRMFARGHQE